MDVRIEFARADAESALLPALGYVAVRAVARLLTALLPMSTFVALLAALLWFAAALYLFVVVTWQRDDTWVAAGIIIGATVLCGGVVADCVSRLIGPDPLGKALLASAGAALWLVLRAVVVAPLAGGFVAGARWITGEVRRSGVWT